jgi:hypothetical protein
MSIHEVSGNAGPSALSEHLLVKSQALRLWLPHHDGTRSPATGDSDNGGASLRAAVLATGFDEIRGTLMRHRRAPLR